MKSLAILLGIVLATAAAPAQDAEIDKLIADRLQIPSVRAWTKPSENSQQALGRIAREMNGGIFFVGNKGELGTAWVVSKKHRLLVTNAHVGDIATSQLPMLAIPSGTSQTYRVEKVWYHPGVRRFLKGTQLSVLSTNPKEGEVDPRSPDLAILQLSSEGPDLHVEFAIATNDELKNLFAASVAMCGFPSHDNDVGPKPGLQAAASYREGVISHITDFLNDAGASHSELQCLQYTMATWGGFSGSPIFLPNGHVAAIHNMARTAKSESETKSIAHGVRVDCLFELLVHHGLEDKVPFVIDKSQVQVARWLKPDRRTIEARARFSQAVELAKEANRLIYHVGQGKEKEAMALCEKAIELAPNYAFAYSTLGGALDGFCFENASRFSKQQRLALKKEALRFYSTAAKLNPNEHWYEMQKLRMVESIAETTDDQDLLRKVIAEATNWTGMKNLGDRNKAFAFYIRANARYVLDEDDDALRDMEQAIQWLPDPAYYRFRAKINEYHGRNALGRKDRAKAEQLEEELRNKTPDVSHLSG